MQSKFYNIADMGMEIRGEGEEAEALQCFFSALEIAKDEAEIPVGLVISVSDVSNISFEPQYYSLSGSIQFSRDSYLLKGRHLTYKVTNLFQENKPTLLDLYYRKRGIVKPFIRFGCMLRGLKGTDKFIRKVSTYKVLWYILAVTLMKHDKIFVHSGMMAKDKLGVVLSGTSGCGKTSTMMEMLERPGWKYMAEDFGIAGGNGAMWESPMHLAIYVSDVKFGNQKLLRAVQGLPLMDRLYWHLKKMLEKDTDRWFSPEAMFSANGVEKKAQVKKVVFLSRVSPSEPLQLEKCTREEAARHIMMASFREIKELYEILNNIRAVGDESYSSIYPDIHELENKYFSIVMRFLANANCFRCRVPFNVGPQKLAEEIMDDTE